MKFPRSKVNLVCRQRTYLPSGGQLSDIRSQVAVSLLPPCGFSLLLHNYGKTRAGGTEIHYRATAVKRHDLLLRQCKGHTTVYTQGLIP